MTYVGRALVARVLDTVRANEGLDSPALAALIPGVTREQVQKALTDLRQSGDVDHVSRFVPTLGFRAWHRLDAGSMALLEWALDTDGAIYTEAAPALGASQSRVYDWAWKLRRAGAVEPSKLVWSWDEATRRRSLAFDALTRWQRGAKVAA